MYTFKNPEFFFLFFLLIPILYYRYFWLSKKKLSIAFSNIKAFKKVSPSIAYKLRFIAPLLRLIAFSLIIIALTRPQKNHEITNIQKEGIDIILALDISGSMRAMDFQPKHRLHVAKKVIESFIKKRTQDRIGLVIFAGESFTQCPLTLDHNIVIEFLRKVDFSLIKNQGTAIGSAIINAGNRLKSSKAKSKVIILLTDGENNQGEVKPTTAAKIVGSLGIKIYTIAIGKGGPQPVKINDPVFGKRVIRQEFPIDEKTLQDIATLTNGKFYRSHSEKQLKSIYNEINKLEKTKNESQQFRYQTESFEKWLWLALLFLLIELILINTRLRKIP